MINKVFRLSQIVRYVVPAGLPVVGAGAGFTAAGSQAPVKVYWFLVALAAILGSGIINAFKTRRADNASRDAVAARANLATAFTKAGQPLVAAVGDVAANQGSVRKAKLETLTSRSVQVAQSQCGRMAQERPGIRATLYRLNGGNLVRVMSEGRAGRLPRARIAMGTANDDAIVKLARGENTLLEPDASAPNATRLQFDDSPNQSYMGFTAVPVRAANRSYGLLVVDSDIANALTEIDAGYVQLIAGLIAAGVAHEEQS